MNPKYRGKSPEEILSMMTLQEKAGQVIVVGLETWEEFERAMHKGIGTISAVAHTEEEAERFRENVARLQREADIPFLVGVDMETGVGQIVHAKNLATEFAEQMALGAIADPEDAKRLAYEEGRVIASEGSALGWNVCYNPVVDVNINPENPITNIRSVGEDPKQVAEITCALIRGIQEGHRMVALAKHFPGAGMQGADSHFALEKTKATREEMEKTHLYPFRKAIEAGVRGMMCNHAIYPMLDDKSVATLSRKIMNDLLREEMGFDGVMYTDAMAMEGLKAQAETMHISETVLAISAGCDLLLGPKEGWDAPDVIVKAVQDGDLPEERLNDSVLRVLKVKQWLGLFDEENRKPLPRMDGWAVAREISRKSITVLKDNDGLLPYDFAGKKVLVIEPKHPARDMQVGNYTNLTLIQESLARFVPQAELALFSPDINKEQEAELVRRAKEADVVIVGTSFRSRSGQVGMLTRQQLDALYAVHEVNPNVIAVVSNPYVTAQLKFIGTVLCCYSTSQVAVEAAVDVLIGKEKALGKQRVTIPEKLKNEVVILYHG